MITRLWLSVTSPLLKLNNTTKDCEVQLVRVDIYEIPKDKMTIYQYS
jgi:hypothetical protein